MPKFEFKCDATERLYGTAYFEVEADTEEEARKKLADDSSEYFYSFSERDGSTEWDAVHPNEWELM